VCFHSDAVQAFGKIPVSLSDVPCTLLTILRPQDRRAKGIGALIVRDRRAVEAIIHGAGNSSGSGRDGERAGESSRWPAP